MDKYLKMFKPAMTKWLRDHYPLEEAKKRWKKTVYLDGKWIREEGDLGGKKNPMASNMLCYIDQITCSAAHGKLIRHKTLADGDGECNYWILGDKDPDALADVGSK